MRDDLMLALRRGGINPDSLCAMQRILLTTDGTVTDMLEAYYREPMTVEPLAQEIIDSPERLSELGVEAGHPVLEREILLRGKVSGRKALHADTIIVPDRLPEQVRIGLLEKREPIGQLLLRDKLETYREIIRCERTAAGALARHFDCYDSAPLLTRTYIVVHAGRGIMRITERFPEYGM
jgi:chorismate-pyruvate lyase